MQKEIKLFGKTRKVPYMSKEEFEKIRMNRDTPEFVLVDGTLMYNEYTCLAGYAGTCNCMSHPLKRWGRFEMDS